MEYNTNIYSKKLLNKTAHLVGTLLAVNKPVSTHFCIETEKDLSFTYLSKIL